MSFSPENTKPRRGILPVPIILAILFVIIVYASFPCQRYFTDGLNDAYRIERSDSWLIHPNHPLMPFLPQVFMKLMGGHRNNPGLRVLMGWSIFFGIVSSILISVLLRRSRVSVSTVVFGLYFFAFSSRVWYFNVTANQYSTALAMNILALLVFQHILQNRSGGFRIRDLLLACPITALAILCHQVNGLLVLPGVFTFYALGGNRKERIVHAIAYVAVTLGMTIGLTALFVLLFTDVRTFTDFIAWQRSYVTHPWYWAHGLLDSLKRSSRGIPELHFAHIWHSEGLFGPLSNWPRWFWLRLSQLAIIAFIVVETMRALVIRLRGNRGNLTQALGFFAWIPFVVFTFVFTPESTNYRIFYVPGFLLLLAPSIDRTYFSLENKMSPALMVFVLAFMLFVGNFIVKFLPESNPAANPFIYEAKTLSALIGPGDLIVFSGAEDDYLRADYAHYFTGADTLLLPYIISTLRSKPEQLIDNVVTRLKRGSKVVINEDALFSAEDIEWLNEYYGMDIRPGELNGYFSNYVRSSETLKLGGKRYFFSELIADP